MYETKGELLADLASVLIQDKRIFDVEMTGDKDRDETAIARVKLALDLRKHPVILFKSIVENWDLSRIVRELY